jgi:hypothetical protein
MMAIDRMEARVAPERDALERFVTFTLKLVLHAVRRAAFAVLALARPVAIPVLSGVAVGGVGLWVIFVPLAHDSEFPTLRVLGMSLGCAVTVVLYYALMELLRPGSLGIHR